MIRLSRVGKKKQPSYRVVVSEKSKDPWGDNTEVVGFYDPLSDPKTVRFEKERVLYWLSVGAKASPTVHNLLVSAGIVGGKKERATKGDIKKRLLRQAQDAAQKRADAAKEKEESGDDAAPEGETKSEAEVPAESSAQDEGTSEQALSEDAQTPDSEPAQDKDEKEPEVSLDMDSDAEKKET